MAKSKMTSIQVRPETRDKLADLGKKRETFDEIIERLIEIAKQGNSNEIPCQA